MADKEVARLTSSFNKITKLFQLISLLILFICVFTVVVLVIKEQVSTLSF